MRRLCSTLYVLKEPRLSKVILEGYVLVSDSDLAAVKRELPNHINLTRQEKGCIVFEVSQDNESINRFNVYEEFVSKDAFKLHQQRLSSTEWGKVSSRLEKHYKTSGNI
jgi:quinol monooxygenase YgiN